MSEKKEHKQEESEQKKSFLPWIIVAVLVIAAIVYWQWPKAEEQKQIESNVAANVDGEEILMSELEREYAKLPPDLKLYYTKAMVLNATIIERLVLAEAKKSGITVTDEEVNQVIKDVATSLNVVPEQFLKELEARGVSQTEALEMFKTKMIIHSFYNTTVLKDVKVAEEEARSFYDANSDQFTLDGDLVRVSHILVDNNSLALANELLTKLKAASNLSAEFEKFAMEYSIDQGSAILGGDLNYATKGQFVPEFEEAAFKLNVGELSPVVQSQFGYHILLLTDKKPAGLVPFEDIKETLVADMRADKEQKAIKDYVDNLLQSAKIEIFLTE